jgi:uncharacterized protein (TIGR02246 family)
MKIREGEICMSEPEIRALYQQLLQAWNDRNATEMASLFETDGITIGFDGSEMQGQDQIGSQIANIFRDHQTAAYVWKVKEVRLLNSETGLLRGIAGMAPPGKSELDPSKHAIQTLLARKSDVWRIVLYQNTPAQFHGRPELVQQMTEELERELKR